MSNEVDVIWLSKDRIKHKVIWSFKLIDIGQDRVVFANNFIKDEFKKRLVGVEAKPLQLTSGKPCITSPNLNIGENNDSCNILKNTYIQDVFDPINKFLSYKANKDLKFVESIDNDYFIVKRLGS